MESTIKPSRLYALLASVAIAVGSVAAMAEDIKVKLVGSEEVPAVDTKASGIGTISIGADKSVSGSVKTTGIQGVAAHIHTGAVGVAGPPIIPLTKGADDTWTVQAGAKLTDEQYAAFKKGDLYVNVHSAEHKGGEIRGQLKP